MTQKTEQF